MNSREFQLNNGQILKKNLHDELNDYINISSLISLVVFSFIEQLNKKKKKKKLMKKKLLLNFYIEDIKIYINKLDEFLEKIFTVLIYENPGLLQKHQL